jgi:hypothetical protein
MSISARRHWRQIVRRRRRPGSGSLQTRQVTFSFNPARVEQVVASLMQPRLSISVYWIAYRRSPAREGRAKDVLRMRRHPAIQGRSSTRSPGRSNGSFAFVRGRSISEDVACAVQRPFRLTRARHIWPGNPVIRQNLFDVALTAWIEGGADATSLLCISSPSPSGRLPRPRYSVQSPTGNHLRAEPRWLHPHRSRRRDDQAQSCRRSAG